MTQPGSPPFLANNAFFYYADVTRAAQFYQEIIGATLVADYGFAKTFQLAGRSFLTLVDATKGMHSASEPKMVTLALVTDQVAGWYDYLGQQQVTIKEEFSPVAGRPHDSFVALDPEGYFLEFERFNDHTENEQLLPQLHRLAPLHAPPATSARPAVLGIKATVLWLYYQNVTVIQQFYATILGLPVAVEQSFASLYRTSPTGYLGPVVAGRGLHPYSEQKAVTISLLTDDIEGWFQRLQGAAGSQLRTPEIVTRDRYRAFVAYDPEGYYMEFNTFLNHPDNVHLLSALQTNS
jgi:predicted enzyme related to lactoylglutathione lyase